MSEIITEIAANGVATVTMNRGEVHNAFNEGVIAALTEAFERLGGDPAVRLVLLRGRGKSFSAGADLSWMQRMAGYGHEENLADAMGLAAMLRAIDLCPKPTVAVVQGPAYGGGVGLAAACDIALASEAASFALTEVRLGLIPAVISPYVVAAMGERACRRYFLTAERFTAAEAHRLGLVHEVVPADGLETAVEGLVARLLECGPASQAAAKDLIRAVARRPTDEAVIRDTAERIARQRASAEGREGVGAFLNKRKPSWNPSS
ncbi:enoyl-CoA hydratase/isomerase family protein [Azospirillum sp. SYSU D00513]|uniref:enoyl-CoA hydratase/isomerase family protein n=1 Tax=Azospirillum sp. SYSU D00513 TaxID=2812561 RepID=UPI001A958D36|nr:enoyl-CoA hydratase/isomerase family protein [Azospirillum sp. SYSU D00513]